MSASSYLKIGIGGIVGFELLTFDFVKGDKLKPYVSEILGPDPVYKLKRNFAAQTKTNYKKNFYSNDQMQAITFRLKKYVVYEYKRFPGDTRGEVVEGYFVILSDSIKELETEEVLHWCNSAKEKEEKKKAEQLSFFNENEGFAPDDIDF
jgi:hypothetical protein